MIDPIVDEVRRVRDAHAARFHYDLDAIFRDIKDQDSYEVRVSKMMDSKAASKQTVNRRALTIVAMTFLSVAFAPARSDDDTKPLSRLKAEVEKLGGTVTKEAKDVILERTGVTDDDLARIAPLLRETPKLSRLRLNHTGITDAGLAHLGGLTRLTWLYLRNTDITDAGLAHLKDLTNLVGLPLENTFVGDEGMKILKGMPKLAWLTLGNTRVGDEGLRQLSGLGRLEVLTLENTPITDAGLVHLKGLSRLLELHLDNTPVTDAGLASLKGLTKLERLYLCDTDVTDAGLINLEGMKDLYYLTLHNTYDPERNAIRQTLKISDEGLVHLHGLTKLKNGSLFLWNTAVTAEGAIRLQKALPQLDDVAFGENRIVGFSRSRPLR